jgi:hypothetical protein
VAGAASFAVPRSLFFPDSRGAFSFITQWGKTRVVNVKPMPKISNLPGRNLHDLRTGCPSRMHTPFSRTKAMLNPSKSDCITILSAASQLADDSMLPLDHGSLGLSRNGMQTAASFLIERACFRRYQEGDGHYAVGALSLQGRWRLEQLSNG